MEHKDIIDFKRWVDAGFSPKDFCEIFNIPFPNHEEVQKSITFLSELFRNYSAYINAISIDGMPRGRERYFSLLFADIFGELAISIKLAEEGYIKYSLRNIRSVLDLIFAGLFTVSSYPPGSAEGEEGINPMAEAFFSGYWDRMKTLDVDAMIPSILMIGEEGKGQSATNILADLTEYCFKEAINKLNLNISKLNDKAIQKLKSSLNQLLKKFFMEIIKSDKGWGQIAKETLGKPDYFYGILMSNPDFALRSCPDHEDKLLQDLKKKLEIKEGMTEDLKEGLYHLVFSGPEFNENEAVPLCDYCENNATTFGFYSRPNTRLMSKLIKLQLPKEELDNIDACIKNSFDCMGRKVTGYFGDIIYSKLYTKLNNYAHSNIAKEPTISEWFYNFVAPTFEILQCILSRALWAGESR